MATIQLHLDSREAQAMIARLGQRAPVAIARSLNRAAMSARTAMARVVSSDMGLKVGDVRERIRVSEATPTRLSATLYASAKRLPLILFRASGAEPSRGRGRGVSVVIQGARKRYPQAFIATMPTGHRGIFQRRGRSRLHIDELKGASIAHVFKKQESVGVKRATESLATNLGHELTFEMSRTT